MCDMPGQPLLDKAIVETLSYFDLIDFPVTREELFGYLWCPPEITYTDFSSYLHAQSGKLWETQGGHYFLPGRSSIIALREQHVVPTEQMLKKARRAARFISWLPFLKAIMVCNSVGSETATGESDIDVLIITEPKRIWLVRFFAHSILRLFGLRTYGNKTAGRMCLSFFVDADHLNMESLRVRPDDIHFVYWLHQMIPLYDAGVFAVRFKEANIWTKAYVPHLYQTQGLPTTGTNQVWLGRVGKFFKYILEKMWGSAYGMVIENEAKKVQWQSITPKIKELAKLQDNNVVLSDGILKFHEHDTRRAQYERWITKTRYASENN